MIYAPIKQGIRVKALYAKNTPLKNLTELFQCQSQGFGERPDFYGPGGHNGLDLVYEDGTELFAPFDGFVYNKTERGGYGKYLSILGPKYKVVYAHLKEFLVPDGQVKRGQLVAKGDSTGNSSGPHLHITVKRVDANGNVLDRNNGHDGAVDPTAFIVMSMFELRQVLGSPEVWLVRNFVENGLAVKRRVHIDNASALLAIGDFASIVPITLVELSAIPFLMCGDHPMGLAATLND